MLLGELADVPPHPLSGWDPTTGRNLSGRNIESHGVNPAEDKKSGGEDLGVKS